MALALIDAARKHRYRAGAVEPDLGTLKASRRRTLDRIGKTQAPQLAGLARAGATRLKTFPIGGLEREIHVLFEFAAVISEGDAGFEWQGARRNGVAPAQLSRIDAELIGSEIDHALDDVTRFRPAIAAIGSHRLGMREHRGGLDMGSRRAIDAGQGAEITGKSRHAGLQIGTDRGGDPGTEAEERAVLVEREFRFGDIIA